MTQIKIEIQDAGVVAALDRLARAGEDLNPVLNAIGRTVKTNVQLGFVAGRDPYGRPWAPLKVRRGQPLRDTNRLMKLSAATRQGLIEAAHACPRWRR